MIPGNISENDPHQEPGPETRKLFKIRHLSWAPAYLPAIETPPNPTPDQRDKVAPCGVR